MKLKNFFGHLKTVNKHRFLVFKLSLKAGIPLISKQENGYSKAWLHHKGRNKHHFEYWYDFNTPDKTPMMPYKYLVELICDNIAASMTYKGKDWNTKLQLEYFNNRKDLDYINSDVKKILIEVYTKIIKNGIDRVLNKKNLKRIYNKYANKNNRG